MAVKGGRRDQKLLPTCVGSFLLSFCVGVEGIGSFSQLTLGVFMLLGASVLRQKETKNSQRQLGEASDPFYLHAKEKAKAPNVSWEKVLILSSAFRRRGWRWGGDSLLGGGGMWQTR
jgi:hypothetical protein